MRAIAYLKARNPLFSIPNLGRQWYDALTPLHAVLGCRRW